MSQVGKPRCQAKDPRRGGVLVQCQKRCAPGEKLCREHLRLERERWGGGRR